VVLTTLMVAAVGVGIGTSMTVLTTLMAMSGNPIPARSAGSVLQIVERTLYSLSRQRVIQNLRPYSATRHLAYTEDRANAVMLVVVSVLMLAVTAFGVVGLTAYWVTQRRQYIGMRRAPRASTYSSTSTPRIFSLPPRVASWELSPDWPALRAAAIPPAQAIRNF
jgi:hypothetical protein